MVDRGIIVRGPNALRGIIVRVFIGAVMWGSILFVGFMVWLWISGIKI